MQNYVSKMKEALNGKKLIFIITGGGSRAISLLLENGGASDIFEGAMVPYSTISIDELCGPKEDRKYCTVEMAKELCDLTLNTKDIVCCAMTCSLIKDNEREGREHKCFMSFLDTNTLSFNAGHISVEGNTRKEQEDFVSDKFLKSIYEFVTGEQYV